MELSGAAAVKYWQGARTDFFFTSYLCPQCCSTLFPKSWKRRKALSFTECLYVPGLTPATGTICTLPAVNNRLGPGECSTPWPCPLSSQLCGGQVLASLSLGTLLVPPLHLLEPFSSAKHIGRILCLPTSWHPPFCNEQTGDLDSSDYAPTKDMWQCRQCL